MQKITIKIEGKEYELELQEDFARYMQKELETHLQRHSNNSAKDILGAYLKKCYECYVLQKRLEELLKKF